nr:hypothetical protein [Tanacetum cinerariifolium]
MVAGNTMAGGNLMGGNPMVGGNPTIQNKINGATPPFLDHRRIEQKEKLPETENDDKRGDKRKHKDQDKQREGKDKKDKKDRKEEKSKEKSEQKKAERDKNKRIKKRINKLTTPPPPPSTLINKVMAPPPPPPTLANKVAAPPPHPVVVNKVLDQLCGDDDLERLYNRKEGKKPPAEDPQTQFDLRPHIKSPNWTEINAGIQQHLQKIRKERPENIMASEWDKYIKFWNDPMNIARAAQNWQNRAKSTVISRQGSRSLARLRDEMTSTTQEYPSLIDTFFMAHTVNEEFLRDEDRRGYEEFRGNGHYTDDEINRLGRGGKQRGHIANVGRVLPARACTPAHDSTLNSLAKSSI